MALKSLRLLQARENPLDKQDSLPARVSLPAIRRVKAVHQATINRRTSLKSHRELVYRNRNDCDRVQSLSMPDILLSQLLVNRVGLNGFRVKPI